MNNKNSSGTESRKTDARKKNGIKAVKIERSKESRRKFKGRSSIVARISSFYVNMFATWFLVSLAFILFFIVGFNVLRADYETRPYVDELKSDKYSTEELRDYINRLEAVKVTLRDYNNTIIASSLPEYYDLDHYGFISVDAANRRVYFSYPIETFKDDGIYRINIFYNITFLIAELLVTGAVLIFLFIISVLVIYIRGSYLTRKAFAVIDELIMKANNISSQNLNLRLNVSESSDELVEFALTFNRMMDRIENAYQKQNQFVSDASHELRTPIAIIQGYARMLERWGKDDKEILQEAITAINKEAKAMQDLVEKLLFIARNDKDTLVLVKEKVNMSELMNELVRDTHMLDTRQEITSHIEPGIFVTGDRDRIKQALRIFVDNAIKYTPPDGKITLRLYREEGYAVSVVKDTGMGIPEDALPKIFDRFYRVDDARDREKGGSGLGLAIARIIVLRHGGRIKVASKPGKGSRFSIYWPMEV